MPGAAWAVVEYARYDHARNEADDLSSRNGSGKGKEKATGLKIVPVAGLCHV
jgi:hypothetical protein